VHAAKKSGAVAIAKSGMYVRFFTVSSHHAKRKLTYLFTPVSDIDGVPGELKAGLMSQWTRQHQRHGGSCFYRS
jgi:hypothetical protein